MIMHYILFNFFACGRIIKSNNVCKIICGTVVIYQKNLKYKGWIIKEIKIVLYNLYIRVYESFLSILISHKLDKSIPEYYESSTPEK